MTFTMNRIVAAIAATALTPALLAGTAMARDKGRGNNDNLGVVYAQGSEGIGGRHVDRTENDPACPLLNSLHLPCLSEVRR